jgi:hypothetical protein
MVWNDASGGQGLIQGSEADCGLGATGITGNAQLFKDFTRWGNDWHKRGASCVIMAFDGHDFDDPNYTTAPTGTFTGVSATRDYNFDGAYKMLKIKRVEVSYDGTTYIPAEPMDDNDQEFAVKGTTANIDGNFSTEDPRYDLIANGFKLYPNFTAAQVSAGAKVYVEFYRAPREFATSGTDSYEPGFDLQFHKLVQLGMSWEYCKLYKPSVAASLAVDLFGNNANIKGMWNEMKEWYNAKSPSNAQIVFKRRVLR